MTSPSNSAVQNLLPVQAYFDAQNNFVTFIGQGQPFYASIDPSQSGLNITNSTINSTTIGLTVPAAAAFTNASMVTGTIDTQPTGATDIVNLLALQSYAAGISWKQPCAVATLTNITLSGLQTIDTYTTLAGDRVLVKDQGTAANNGIYIASAGPWTRALDADAWNDFVAAITFIEYGTQKGGAWFCTAQPGGTLGVTALNWSQFTTSATYTAGTGLTLTGFEFSITNTGVPANTYGSATATPVFAVNAQGQITSVTNTTITPAIGNVTGLGTGVATFLATPTSVNLAAIVSDETGSGALVFAQSPTLITPALGTPASGVMTNVTGLPLTTGVTGTLPIANGGTGQITASAAFNALSPITTIGDMIYGSAANTSSRLGIGTDGQVLTVVAGIPAWVSVGSSVSSFSGGSTGLTPATATTGAVTLAGTLNIANGGTGITVFGTGVQTALGQAVTGSGGIALATSPVFTTPNLGTPSAATLTNATGLPVSTGISGLGTGVATALAVAVGSVGAFVTNGGALGTPSSGVATNLTGTAAGLSIGGNAATATTATSATSATNATNIGITDDTTTNATVYPVWVTTTTGNLPAKTASTKFSFNPSTGALSSTSFSGAGTGLTGTASSLSIGGNAATATTATNVSGGTASVTTLTVGGASQNAQLGQGDSSAMKNRLINGACMIDQRYAGASVSITNGEQYVIDRWLGVSYGGNAVSFARSTNAPAGFAYSFGATNSGTTVPGTSSIYTFRQKIEGLNASDLNFGLSTAKTITVSFWATSSVTGTYVVGIINGALNRSNRSTFTINSANTWEYKSVTFTGDTTGTWAIDNTTWCYLDIVLSAGTNNNETANTWTANTKESTTSATNTWCTTNGATFNITGAQLEAGSYPTGFEYRSISDQLSLCQRYFEKTFALGTAPAHNTGEFITWPTAGSLGCGGNSYFTIMFATRKRARNATLRLYDPNAAHSATENWWRYWGGCGPGTAVGPNVGIALGCEETFISGNTATATGISDSFNWTAESEL